MAKKIITSSFVVVLALFLTMPTLLISNNLSVSNISLTGLNTAQSYILVEFDISWENSWRMSSGPSNWDAAWVFIKYSANTGDWQHATLNYVNGTGASDGHTEPSGSTINTSSDGKGIFITRYIFKRPLL